MNITDSMDSFEGLEPQGVGTYIVNPNARVRMPDGRLFACICDCNIFHKKNGQPNTYYCNSCDEIYTGS